MYLVHKCDKEISGLGKVRIEGGTVRIVDMCLLEQEVTGSTTDIKSDAVSKALYEAYKDGLQDGELLWWWHSHVNMQVFWSGTDMATIREFGKNGRFFATVFNKKAEHRSAYFQAGNETYPEAFMDNIDTEIDFGLTDDEKKGLDAEFKAKVKEKKYQNKYPLAQGNYGKKKDKRKKSVSSKFDEHWGWKDDIFDEVPSDFWEDDYWHTSLIGGNK